MTNWAQLAVEAAAFQAKFPDRKFVALHHDAVRYIPSGNFEVDGIHYQPLSSGLPMISLKNDDEGCSSAYWYPNERPGVNPLTDNLNHHNPDA